MVQASSTAATRGVFADYYIGGYGTVSWPADAASDDALLADASRAVFAAL